MKQQESIENSINFAKNFFENTEGSHDWWHTFRVLKMAEGICKREDADLFIVSMAAILHDVADYKLHEGSEEKGLSLVSKHLKELEVSGKDRKHIMEIIEKMSFRKNLKKENVLTVEGQIVQDADRLDALGAIGIARTFSYGGAIGSIFYDPEIKPNLRGTKKGDGKNRATSINHFYEKILLLKDTMKTKTGKKMAQKRHKFIEDYLDHFFTEWTGKI